MINNFKALITKRGGLSVANRFDVMITLPLGIVAADRGRDLTLLCESASLPGKQITTIEWSMYGHATKIPTGFILDDVNLVFNITNDFYAKRVFDEWQNLVINPKTYNLAYDDSFKVDMLIRQLDEQNRVIYTAKLQKAYPITVNQITVDANSENTIQKLSVAIAYTNCVNS